MIALGESAGRWRLVRLVPDPERGAVLAPSRCHPKVLLAEARVELDGAGFLIAPFLEGVTLSELLQLAAERRRPIPAAVASRIVLDLLDGLAAYQYVVNAHGGVSPRSAFVGADGVTRLLAPRLARRHRRSPRPAHRFELAYSSPEALAGEAPTTSSDVFSAGVVAWEAFAGRRLFTGRTDADVTRKVVVDPIPRLSTIEPAALVVEEVVRSALARTASGRYEDAASMWAALSFALRAEGAIATSAEVATVVGSLARDAFAARSAAIAALVEDARRGDEPKVAIAPERARSPSRELPTSPGRVYAPAAPAAASSGASAPSALAALPPVVAGLSPPPRPVGWRRTPDGFASASSAELALAAVARPSRARRSILGWVVAIGGGLAVGLLVLRIAGVSIPIELGAQALLESARPSPDGPTAGDRAPVVTRRDARSDDSPVRPPDPEPGIRLSLADLPSAPAAPPRVQTRAFSRPSSPPEADLAGPDAPPPPSPRSFVPAAAAKKPEKGEADVPPNPYET